MKINERFANIRLSTGLNKKQFAESLGINQSVAGDIELGKREPSREVMLKLTTIYKVNINWLLTGEGAPFNTIGAGPPGATLGVRLPGAGIVPSENLQPVARLDKGGAIRPVNDAPTAIAKTYSVPVLKQTVACGPGIDWETNADNIENVLEVDAFIPNLGLGRIFAIKAHGSSMAGAGIKGGDYLFFDAGKEIVPLDGIYVFALDGDVYCKRLEFEKLAKKVRIFSMRTPDIEKAELITMLDMSDNDFSDRFRIFGRVVRLLRKFEKEE
jgi:SOS-response transcriptional repressor LexA